jgi:hypothetical protein
MHCATRVGLGLIKGVEAFTVGVDVTQLKKSSCGQLPVYPTPP